MCQYCGCYSQYQGYPGPYYSPYQYSGMSYGYPMGGYGGSYYGLPLGYAYYPSMYTPSVYPYGGAVTMPSPPVTYAPALPRGEHRVGNCLMICQ